MESVTERTFTSSELAGVGSGLAGRTLRGANSLFPPQGRLQIPRHNSKRTGDSNLRGRAWCTCCSRSSRSLCRSKVGLLLPRLPSRSSLTHLPLLPQSCPYRRGDGCPRDHGVSQIGLRPILQSWLLIRLDLPQRRHDAKRSQSLRSCPPRSCRPSSSFHVDAFKGSSRRSY